MSFVEIKRAPSLGRQPAKGVSIGSYAHKSGKPICRIRIAANVAHAAGITPQQRVAIFVGEDEDSGKVALKASESGIKALAIGGRKSISVSSMLIPNSGTAQPTRSVPYEIRDDMLVITLPEK